MSFQYVIRHPGKKRFPKADAIAALRRFARMNRNRPFRTADFDAWPDRPCCANTVISRFGTWNRALAAIRLKPVAVRVLDNEKVLRDVERVWRKVGAAPKIVQFRAHGTVSHRAVRLRWGSLRRCCELIAAHHRGELSRNQILAAAGPVNIRKNPSALLRIKILRRDAYRCVLCGNSPATNSTYELHIDHITPVARGGTNAESNLRTLCRECNVQRRDTTPLPEGGVVGGFRFARHHPRRTHHKSKPTHPYHRASARCTPST